MSDRKEGEDASSDFEEHEDDEACSLSSGDHDDDGTWMTKSQPSSTHC